MELSVRRYLDADDIHLFVHRPAVVWKRLWEAVVAGAARLRHCVKRVLCFFFAVLRFFVTEKFFRFPVKICAGCSGVKGSEGIIHRESLCCKWFWGFSSRDKEKEWGLSVLWLSKRLFLLDCFWMGDTKWQTFWHFEWLVIGSDLCKSVWSLVGVSKRVLI